MHCRVSGGIPGRSTRGQVRRASERDTYERHRLENGAVVCGLTGRAGWLALTPRAAAVGQTIPCPGLVVSSPNMSTDRHYSIYRAENKS